jgi:hypothetical protein
MPHLLGRATGISIAVEIRRKLTEIADLRLKRKENCRLQDALADPPRRGFRVAEAGYYS